jgi:hypothetical protein
LVLDESIAFLILKIEWGKFGSVITIIDFFSPVLAPSPSEGAGGRN